MALHKWKLVISDTQLQFVFPKLASHASPVYPMQLFPSSSKGFPFGILTTTLVSADWSTEKFIATKHLKKAGAPHDASKCKTIWEKILTIVGWKFQITLSLLYSFSCEMYDGSCVFWLLLCQASLIRDNCVKRSSGSSPSSSSQHQQQ